MGRMHSFGKGISKSALPYKRTPPSWCKTTTREVVDQIVKYARKGFNPSKIGRILRDSHGIAQVKNLTGRKILRILKHQGIAPAIPEDLYHLIKKAGPYPKTPRLCRPILCISSCRTAGVGPLSGAVGMPPPLAAVLCLVPVTARHADRELPAPPSTLSRSLLPSTRGSSPIAAFHAPAEPLFPPHCALPASRAPTFSL